jgi:hypothetical protein
MTMSSGGSTGGTTVQFNLNTDLSAERFPAWIALMTFSIICLTAETSRRDADKGLDNTSKNNWVLAVLSISLILSVVSVVAYLVARMYYVNQQAEMGVVRVYRLLEVQQRLDGSLNICFIFRR